MKTERFLAWIQAIISILFLLFCFAVILLFELGMTKLTTPGQEKTFDSMVNWMTGGALIVLYFWLQRSKGNTVPDPETSTIEQRTTITSVPKPGAAVPAVTPAVEPPTTDT